MQEIIKNPRKIFPGIRLEVSIFKRSAEGDGVDVDDDICHNDGNMCNWLVDQTYFVHSYDLLHDNKRVQTSKRQRNRRMYP